MTLSFTLILLFVLKYLGLILPILIAVAFLTLVERKVLASIQNRVGPNAVGLLGLLQPFADAAKLLLKETILPSSANKWLFIIAPILTFSLSLISWIVIPISQNETLTDTNIGIFYLLAISSLNVYGIIIAGWASNSRYAFLGAIRSAAQMISYEVSIGLIILNIFLCVGSLNITKIVMFQEHVWFIIPFAPLFILFFISALAETSRSPFDLTEAEGELVAGFSVEYSSTPFALFFIGEYLNIILMAALAVILFFGGWHPVNVSIFIPFFLKALLAFGPYIEIHYLDATQLLFERYGSEGNYYTPSILETISTLDLSVFEICQLIYVFLYKTVIIENLYLTSLFTTQTIFVCKVLICTLSFIWVRATLPRYRYDTLMRLTWKVYLPFAFGYFILTASILYIFDALP